MVFSIVQYSQNKSFHVLLETEHSESVARAAFALLNVEKEWSDRIEYGGGADKAVLVMRGDGSASVGAATSELTERLYQLNQIVKDAKERAAQVMKLRKLEVELLNQ